MLLAADVKPIVSLDESPSPGSNMDDSSYSNYGQGILENSLAGISPGSQLPNSSSKCLLVSEALSVRN